jgi:hypothetical protein
LAQNGEQHNSVFLINQPCIQRVRASHHRSKGMRLLYPERGYVAHEDGHQQGFCMSNMFDLEIGLHSATGESHEPNPSPGLDGKLN